MKCRKSKFRKSRRGVRILDHPVLVLIAVTANIYTEIRWKSALHPPSSPMTAISGVIGSLAHRLACCRGTLLMSGFPEAFGSCWRWCRAVLYPWTQQTLAIFGTENNVSENPLKELNYFGIFLEYWAAPFVFDCYTSGHPRYPDQFYFFLFL